jgi:hypothetical protein
MPTRLLLALPAVSLILLTSCRDPKIRNYQIAKEPSAHVPPGMVAPTATQAQPAIHWKKPDAWQEQTGKSMRVGSFLIAETNGVKTELAITTFPGDVGGDFANVNRWRSQIQLPPITEVELPAAITSIDLPAGKFQLVDLTSTEPLLDGKYKARILGAWLKQPDRTWFFKITGDAETVGAQHESLRAFLETVEFSAPAATPAAAAEPAPAAKMAAPDMMAGSVPPPPASDNPIAWTAPANWTPKPLGQMRKGSYAVGEADLSITMLSAAANPLLENINRWRRQITLAPLTEAELPAQTTTITSGDLQITVIDYANATSRVLGGILYRGDEAWFFKLSGPDATVAAQKPAFLDFLKTVKAR